MVRRRVAQHTQFRCCFPATINPAVLPAPAVALHVYLISPVQIFASGGAAHGGGAEMNRITHT
jgi:hypothetical protein